MFSVEFYTKSNGEKPAWAFIESFDEKVQAKLLRGITLLENNGPELRRPHSAKLDDKIFELRVQEASNIYRVLYFFFVGKRIVMTHGFVKKTQKTPPNEIARAKYYMNDFFRQEAEKQKKEQEGEK